MPTIVRPPLPPRAYSGIPYHRFLHQELSEAIRRVIKGVLFQIDSEGLPDLRIVEIVVDREAQGLIMPPQLWALLDGQPQLKLAFSFQAGLYRDLKLTEEGFGASFSFGWAPHEWVPIGVPWEAVLGLIDRQEDVVLQLPTSEDLPRDLREPTEGERAEAKGIAQRLAEEAFEALGKDEPEH